MRPAEAMPGDESRDSVRVLRVIARLNIGGPAIQAVSLTKLMQPLGYETRLVRGVEAPDEGSLDHLAARLGVRPTLLPTMRRDPGPGDIRALIALLRILRRDRPHLVHTHAAKGGALGRIATLIAFPRRRPVVVHTFHGHSLTSYFSARRSRAYTRIERTLARRSDVLIAVSPEVRDDLVRLRIARPDKVVVVPLGLDLSRFLDDGGRADRGAAVRTQLGIRPDEEVVTLVARLVPIKRVDRFLEVAARLADRPKTRFVIVGDGELRDELMASAAAGALGDRLVWAGFRHDMPEVCFASEVVVLTSDNEGTPVSLIEAQAAAVPVVSTAVGGVRSAVLDRETGLLADRDDIRGLAAAVRVLLDDPGRARQMAVAGRTHAAATFGIARLVGDLDRLYRDLLER